ncbi:hypothetical protein Tco_1486845, partial [Tanacetum coccineum]
EPESNEDNNVETVTDDAEIVSLGSIKINEVIEDAFSDLESMPDDEIILPEVIADSLNLKFPQLLNASIKENLPSINKKIRRALNMEMPDILAKSLRSVNKQFNALNKLEAYRFTQLAIFTKHQVKKHI